MEVAVTYFKVRCRSFVSRTEESGDISDSPITRSQATQCFLR
jgi:hypothetical protein